MISPQQFSSSLGKCSFSLKSIYLLPIVLFVNPLFSICILGFFNILGRVSIFLSFIWGVKLWALFPSDAHLFPSAYGRFANDIPFYYDIIENLSTLSLPQAFLPQFMSGYEPIPQLLWFSLRQFGFSTELIISLQLFIWIQVFIIAAQTLSTRYSIFIIIVGLCLYPNILLFALFSLYRSSWAFSFLCLFFIFQSRSFKFTALTASVLSHFLALPALLFRFSNRILSPKVLLFFFISILLFIRSGLLQGLLLKINFYSLYNAEVEPSTLFSLFFTIFISSLLFIFSTNRDDLFILSFFLLLLYVVLFITPVLTLAASRYFVLIAPISFMVLVSRQKPFLIYCFVTFSVYRFYVAIGDGTSALSIFNHSFFTSLL
jgi:hypothetical protein